MFTVMQAARYAGVSNTTIRNWSSDYRDFLSPTANPPRGVAREYTEDDLRVFATVATLRSQLVEVAEIVAALADGQRYEPVKPPTEEARPDDDQAAATAIEIYKDLLTQEKTRADKLSDRLIEAESRAAAAEREIAILRELYQSATTPPADDRRPSFWEWITGRRR